MLVLGTIIWLIKCSLDSFLLALREGRLYSTCSGYLWTRFHSKEKERNPTIKWNPVCVCVYIISVLVIVDRVRCWGDAVTNHRWVAALGLGVKEVFKSHPPKKVE